MPAIHIIVHQRTVESQKIHERSRQSRCIHLISTFSPTTVWQQLYNLLLSECAHLWHLWHFSKKSKMKKRYAAGGKEKITEKPRWGWERPQSLRDFSDPLQHNQQPDPGRDNTSFLLSSSTIAKKIQYNDSDSSKAKTQKDLFFPLFSPLLSPYMSSHVLMCEGCLCSRALKKDGDTVSKRTHWLHSGIMCCQQPNAVEGWNSCTLPATGGGVQKRCRWHE